MLSLITVFIIMMLPAFAVLAISFIVSVFENKTNVFTACDNSSLIEGATL